MILRIDTHSIVTNAHTQMLGLIRELDIDGRCSGMSCRIGDRFFCY